MFPATADECEDALMVLHGTMGLGPNGNDDAFAQRISEMAAILASSGWTRAALMEATKALASSPELDDKIRYGRPITAADFERIRRGDEREEDDRIITTYRGFALKVRQAKLYTFTEAFGLWGAAGSPGTFGDSRTKSYPNSMFAFVDVEGEPFWKLK